MCSLLINLWDFFFGRFWCLPFFFHHGHTDLGALFCPSPSFWKLCIAQCRSLFSDTILLASVQCAAFLFINLHICYILKSAVKSEIYLILVLISDFSVRLAFPQQQKALMSGGVMRGALKALTHEEKSLWMSSSVQVLQILLSLTLTWLSSTPTYPLSSHLNAEDPFCKFWSGSIWITTYLLSAFRWNMKHLPVRENQNMCYGNAKLIH